MPITERMRYLLSQQAALPQILAAARADGIRTLQRAAAEKVLDGTNTVSKMLRVTAR